MLLAAVTPRLVANPAVPVWDSLLGPAPVSAVGAPEVAGGGGRKGESLVFLAARSGSFGQLAVLCDFFDQHEKQAATGTTVAPADGEDVRTVDGAEGGKGTWHATLTDRRGTSLEKELAAHHSVASIDQVRAMGHLEMTLHYARHHFHRHCSADTGAGGGSNKQIGDVMLDVEHSVRRGVAAALVVVEVVVAAWPHAHRSRSSSRGCARASLSIRSLLGCWLGSMVGWQGRAGQGSVCPVCASLAMAGTAQSARAIECTARERRQAHLRAVGDTADNSLPQCDWGRAVRGCRVERRRGLFGTHPVIVRFANGARTG